VLLVFNLKFNIHNSKFIFFLVRGKIYYLSCTKHNDMKKHISFLFSLLVFSSSLLTAQTWQRAGKGVNGTPLCFAVYNNELYVGGRFEGNFAKWDGMRWNNAISNIDGSICTMVEYKGELYAGGYFTAVNGKSFKYIARWDGKQWQEVGKGTDSPVLSLLVYNNELYVAGKFDNAGGAPANHIAKWDGSKWTAVGKGSDVTIEKIGLSNNVIYASPFFQNDGADFHNIGMWNGTDWSPVGKWSDGIIFSFASFNNKLFAAGHFTEASSGVAAGNIAVWDGTKWSSPSKGMSLHGNTYDANVKTLAVINGTLFAGGQFDTADGHAANGLAYWGNVWMAGNGNIRGTVNAIIEFNGELFIGGDIANNENDRPLTIVHMPMKK
jgi:hypothetical protein